MPTAHKVLGQHKVAVVDTLETLYTVPASTEAVISTLTICNRSATAGAKVRVAVRVAGGAIADEDYLYYDLVIPTNETFATTIGITLAATDVVSVYAESTDISFNLFGQEIT